MVQSWKEPVQTVNQGKIESDPVHLLPADVSSELTFIAVLIHDISFSVMCAHARLKSIIGASAYQKAKRRLVRRDHSERLGMAIEPRLSKR